MRNLKKQEAQIRRGLSIFKIDQVPSKDLHTLEKDLEYLEQIWSITREWEELWDQWKGGKFSELETSNMETTSQLLYKKLNKLVREIKVCKLQHSRQDKNLFDSTHVTLINKITYY